MHRIKKKINFIFNKYIIKNTLDTNTIIKHLKDCGIEKNDTVMVHSSMSKIGVLDNGALTIIEALQSLISKNGLIILPSFPHRHMFNYLESSPIFRLAESPSMNGIISETFRTSSDVFRSLHPTHPVCAWGRNAETLVKGHEHSLCPFDDSSPYKKLIDLNAKVLLIGVHFQNLTMCRVIEDLVDNYPSPYLEKNYAITCLDANKKRHIVYTKCHDPNRSKVRNNTIFFPYLNDLGLVKHAYIGNAKTLMVHSKDLFQIQKKLHLKNIYGYEK